MLNLRGHRMQQIDTFSNYRFNKKLTTVYMIKKRGGQVRPYGRIENAGL
jgi:hypothetical protein